MATATKKAPLVRFTYYLGKKKIQTGALKGGVRPGFIALQPSVAVALGIKLQLPKDIPATTYTVENGIIFDAHPVKGGKTVKRPVRGQVGKKKISVVVADTKSRIAGGAKGGKAKSTPSTTKTITLGVPTWASIETLQTFLKGSRAISFAFNGQQRPVTTTKAGAK
jgi:hypothetical protein